MADFSANWSASDRPVSPYNLGKEARIEAPQTPEDRARLEGRFSPAMPHITMTQHIYSQMILKKLVKQYLLMLMENVTLLHLLQQNQTKMTMTLSIKMSNNRQTKNLNHRCLNGYARIGVSF